MADYYVYSGGNGASPSAPGAGWAGAYATLDAAITASSAASADRIFVADDHATEQFSNAATKTFAIKGVLNFVHQIICVSRVAGNFPPLAADMRKMTNSFQMLGGNVAGSMSLTGYFYAYGLRFVIGDNPASSGGVFSLGSGAERIMEECEVALNHSTTTAYMQLSGNSAGLTDEWINATLSFGHVSQQLRSSASNIILRATDKRKLLKAGSVVPTNFCATWTANAADIDGYDLTDYGAGKTLMQIASASGSRFRFSNCKLNAAVTRASIGTLLAHHKIIEMVNCTYSGAPSMYWFDKIDSGGIIATETAIVRAASVDPRGVPLSLKFTPDATRNSRLHPVQFPEFEDDNALTGARTLTVELLGPAGLTSADFFVEAGYLGDADSPIIAWSTTRPRILDAGTALTASSATWLNKGSLTSYKIEVPIAPAQGGVIRWRAFCAKNGATNLIYLDPQASIA